MQKISHPLGGQSQNDVIDHGFPERGRAKNEIKKKVTMVTTIIWGAGYEMIQYQDLFCFNFNLIF